MHADSDIVLPFLSDRPSVCLPNAGTVSKRMDIPSHFWRSGSGIILVFWALLPLQNSKDNPLRGDAKCTGWENLANIANYLENSTR